MRPGFTLLYGGIVLALIAVILSLLFPRFVALDIRAVESEVRKLHQVCWFLRQRALATGHPQVLTIDSQSNAYHGAHYTERLAPSVMFGVIPGVKGPPSNPTQPLDFPVTFKDSTITFYPDGIIESGAVYMTDKDQRVMYALSSGVGHASYIRMYKHRDSWELIE